jgi:hypothetical protein
MKSKTITKIINTGKKVVGIGREIGSQIKKNPEIFKEMLLINLNNEIIKKKRIVVPEATIRATLKNILHEIPYISLESLQCQKDSIQLTFNISKYGTQSLAGARFQIIEAVIERENQLASIRIFDEKLIGKNIMGKCVTALINLIINDLFKTTVSLTQTNGLLNFSDQDRVITVDLSKLKAIQNLLLHKNSMNLCVLDIASFSFGHDINGIYAKGEFHNSVEKLELFGNRLMNFKKKILDNCSGFSTSS